MTEHQHGASDVTPSANLWIWGYFFAFGLALYLIITGLTFYFRYHVEREQYEKVGSVKSPELVQLRQHEEQVLNGSMSVVENKKNMPIDEAMDRVIAAYQKAQKE
jgi:hypothetical protein